MFTHEDKAWAKRQGLILVASRDEAVDRFGERLDAALADPAMANSPMVKYFRDLVEEYRKSKNLILVCWCDPLRCHAEKIRDAILREIGDNRG